MAHHPDRLTPIRVKTAKMLELHALLQEELDHVQALDIPPHERDKLNRAISTLATAMREIEANFAQNGKINAPSPAANELDQLVDALLRFHMPNTEGE